MAAIKIANADEFKLLFDGLATDIVSAGWHWKICHGLEMAASEYGLEFAQSPTFWGLTSKAHDEAALFSLFRAYDGNRRSLNLRNLLDTIAANMYMFDVEAFRERLKDNPFVETLAADARKPDAAQLNADLDFVTNNPVVKALHGWRHNLFAHRSPDVALGTLKLDEKFRIIRPEIRGLIERGLEILNRYSGMFNAVYQSTSLIGEDDFTATLNAVRHDLERQDRAVQELMQKLSPPGG